MTLILVRHGESEGNAQRIIQGSLDTALTPLGWQQAEAVGLRFAGYELAAIYGTSLRRSFDTARTIAAHHPIEPQRIPDLSERTFGEAQGLPWAEVRARWSVADESDWWSGIPGVEPLPEFRERAARAMEALLARHEGELALAVSHGGTIGQLVAYTLEMGTHEWARIQVGNTSVTVIERERGFPVIKLLNDLCHLRPAEETAPPPA